MPRSFSMDIQSEVTPRRPALPCTAPAWVMADACSASASVRVDLPASGWLITANARRRPASAPISTRARNSLAPLEEDTDAGGQERAVPLDLLVQRPQPVPVGGHGEAGHDPDH